MAQTFFRQMSRENAVTIVFSSFFVVHLCDVSGDDAQLMWVVRRQRILSMLCQGQGWVRSAQIYFIQETELIMQLLSSNFTKNYQIKFDYCVRLLDNVNRRIVAKKQNSFIDQQTNERQHQRVDLFSV